jgi:ketosteroid isomerase-like protein
VTDRTATDAERLATLEAILDGFNAHDPDVILEHFTDDAVFDAPRGTGPGGARFVGRAAIREAFAQRFAGIPDIRYHDGRHAVAGDRGLSEWTIRGTTASGEPIEVRGCDLWEFDGRRISRKDSYWKRIEG